MYKSKLAVYTEQEEALASIISYIQETITAENAVDFQDTKPRLQ